MLIGHYAASFALKKIEPKSSLGMLFLMVQLSDILFFSLVLLGIEKLEIVPRYTASTNFALPFMPYSHSLIGTLALSVLVFVITKIIVVKKRKIHSNRLPAVFALAVLSHWFLDFIVHTPDLLLWGDNSLKVGLGLWNYGWISFGVEVALLFAGAIIFLRKAPELKKKVSVFAACLVIFQLANLLFPTPKGVPAFALSALIAYSVIAGAALFVEKRQRRA